MTRADFITYYARYFIPSPATPLPFSCSNEQPFDKFQK